MPGFSRVIARANQRAETTDEMMSLHKSRECFQNFGLLVFIINITLTMLYPIAVNR
jgi:hypothetical protein